MLPFFDFLFIFVRVIKIKNNTIKTFPNYVYRYKECLGFKPQTAFICQGATLSKEVLEYLAGFDILVHEAYGQSETSGLLCANIPKRYCKPGTTGKVCVVADTLKPQREYSLLQKMDVNVN